MREGVNIEKHIYKVHLHQEFDCYTTTFFRQRRIEHGKGTNDFQYKFVYALNEQDAELKYKNTYKVDYNMFEHEYYWGYSKNDRRVITENSINTPIAEICNDYTFEELKEKMNSDDLMEYCKQKMYPVEKLIKKY